MCLGLIACCFQVISCIALLRKRDSHAPSAYTLRLAILLAIIGLIGFLPWQGLVVARVASRSLRVATAVASANYIFIVCQLIGLVMGIAWLKSACRFGNLKLEGPLFWAVVLLVVAAICAALGGIGNVALAAFGSLRPPASGGTTGQFPVWQRLIRSYVGTWRVYIAAPCFIAATSAMWISCRRFHQMLRQYPRSQGAAPCRT
jgi:hypothetical protein